MNSVNMTLRDEDSNLDQIYVNQVVLANYNSTLQEGTYVIMHFRTALRNHMRIVFEGMFLSLDAMLKLFKTKSEQKLFSSDCITL